MQANEVIPLWDEECAQAWNVPKQMTVSEWSDNHRYLDFRSSAEPGKWNTTRTPYLRGVMDAFNDPFIRSITIMASTQIGKTECELNFLGYAIDQDPGPTLWVTPTEELAKSFARNRIHPMVEQSPKVSEHLTGYDDDMSQLEMRFDRMTVFMAWANSPAALASRPCKYVIFDELDKYPKFSGKEADPVKLAEERVSTFWNHKIVKVSTPTTKEGYIYNDYEKTDKCQYYVPCPHCGHYQVLTFHQIMWPKDGSTSQVIKDKRLAWYECLKCKGEIRDIHKNKMLQAGVWCPDKCEVNKDGKIIGEIPVTTKKGFWISALYSPWMSFSDLAAEFLESKDNVNDLMNFINSKLAEIWEEKSKKTEVDHVKTLSLHYPEGLVEDGVMVLTAGVDVQVDHFYMTIRGWGYGEENWLVRAARIEHWSEVINALFNTVYKKRNGLAYKVRMACIDSGYRTDEVYEVCRRYAENARPTKGDTRIAGLFSQTTIDRYTKTGKPIPGGLSMYRVNVDYFKDKIHRMVHSEAGDSAKWHNYKDVPETYLRQFCSEDKVVKRDRKSGKSEEVWMPKAKKTPNHYWDCEVLATAAAEMIHVPLLREEKKEQVYKPQKESGSFAGHTKHLTNNWTIT